MDKFKSATPILNQRECVQSDQKQQSKKQSSCFIHFAITPVLCYILAGLWSSPLEPLSVFAQKINPVESTL